MDTQNRVSEDHVLQHNLRQTKRVICGFYCRIMIIFLRSLIECIGIEATDLIFEASTTQPSSTILNMEDKRLETLGRTPETFCVTYELGRTHAHTLRVTQKSSFLLSG